MNGTVNDCGAIVGGGEELIPSCAMQVRVNGELLTLPDGATVAELLRRVAADPTQVAVERNLDVVPRRSYNEAALADGDEVEIVTFVGGG